MSSSVQVSSGVLLTSDEQTIVYLLYCNENLPYNHGFIISQLDSCNLFVRGDRVKFVSNLLRERNMQHVFDEDETTADG